MTESLETRALDNTATGAMIQSLREHNPRGYLRRLRDANPAMEAEQLRDLMWDELAENSVWNTLEFEGLFRTIFDYWFQNNHRSLFVKSRQRSDEERQALLVEMAKRDAARVKNEAKIMLIDMVMPNGKKFGDCSGFEAVRLAKTLGPWVMRVARKLKPRQHVRSVFNEEQLQALYSTSGFNSFRRKSPR